MRIYILFIVHIIPGLKLAQEVDIEGIPDALDGRPGPNMPCEIGHLTRRIVAGFRHRPLIPELVVLAIPAVSVLVSRPVGRDARVRRVDSKCHVRLDVLETPVVGVQEEHAGRRTRTAFEAGKGVSPVVHDGRARAIEARTGERGLVNAEHVPAHSCLRDIEILRVGRDMGSEVSETVPIRRDLVPRTAFDVLQHDHARTVRPGVIDDAHKCTPRLAVLVEFFPLAVQGREIHAREPGYQDVHVTGDFSERAVRCLAATVRRACIKREGGTYATSSFSWATSRKSSGGLKFRSIYACLKGTISALKRCSKSKG